MRRRLWRNHDFLQLWAGETVSLFGSEITELAIPLAALLVLNASPAELGLLAAARFAPFLVFTLPVGLIADRRRRKPILIWANVGRAAAIALVPLLAAAGVLSFPILFGLTAAVGVLTVFFDISYVSYVPSLVDREELVDANSWLQASASAAGVGGPGLGGILVQTLSAPVALAVNAATYLVSAINLAMIRREEAAPIVEADRKIVAELRDGFALLWSEHGLRALAGVAASYNLFSQWISVLFVIFTVETLGLSPASLGLVFSAGAAGALLGAVAAGSAARRLGFGRAIVWAVTAECAAMVPVGLVHGPHFIVLPVLFGLLFVNGCFVTMSSVHALAYRQAVAPDRLLGRLTASYRFISYSTIPLGALLGGFAGELFGVRVGLIVGSTALLSAAAFALASPLRRMRELPRPS